MAFLDKTGLFRLWQNILALTETRVPNTRTVNGKPLVENITLSASDVNAYTKTEIDNIEFVTVDDIDTICGGSIVIANAREVTF